MIFFGGDVIGSVILPVCLIGELVFFGGDAIGSTILPVCLIGELIFSGGNVIGSAILLPVCLMRDDDDDDDPPVVVAVGLEAVLLSSSGRPSCSFGIEVIFLLCFRTQL